MSESWALLKIVVIYVEYLFWHNLLWHILVMVCSMISTSRSVAKVTAFCDDANSIRWQYCNILWHVHFLENPLVLTALTRSLFLDIYACRRINDFLMCLHPASSRQPRKTVSNGHFTADYELCIISHNQAVYPGWFSMVLWPIAILFHSFWYIL